MPRVSGNGAAYSYALVDGDPSFPIEQVEGGVFGPYSAYFPVSGPGNGTQRLFVARKDAPEITAGIAGPSATVSLFSWVRLDSNATTHEGLVAGVWDEEWPGERQYAIFLDLGACQNATVWNHGLAAHISNVGGPTPGQRYCVTRACDPRPIPNSEWHCLTTVYDGQKITAFVNGTSVNNGYDQPFYYPGGIFSPEAAGRPGAGFSVGANFVNTSTTNPAPTLSNRFKGRVGGVAVFNTSLSAEDVAAVCAQAAGFEHHAPRQVVGGQEEEDGKE